jgi:iron complex outermembrane receptor protein
MKGDAKRVGAGAIAFRSVLFSTAAVLAISPATAFAQSTQAASPAAETPQSSSTSPDIGTPAGEPTSVQEIPPPGNEIVVTGIRATQRSSLAVKRNASTIVDAIMSEEIGATPDQSVAETLERITGVTADRFKGSASEISIRGLGPFLGFSTLNGREVTSGSGDRAVSFQQFPSELVNGVLVYKSQEADLIEGGTSGIIELRTIRPLDYGRRRIQGELRGVLQNYDDKIIHHDGLSYRGSASYTDQYATGIGDIGVSIGYSRVDSSDPEDFYTTSSSFRPCNSIATNPDTNGNCSYDPDSSNPVYFASNSYVLRQDITRDLRDAVLGSVQWQPSSEWNIALDGQYSARTSLDNYHDLVIAEARRGIAPTEINEDGALIGFDGNSRLEAQTRLRDRAEEYVGGGLTTEYTSGDFELAGDLSYSRTHRNQVDRQTRLRTADRIPYHFDGSGELPPDFFFDPSFDVTDHDLFNDAAYARRQMEDRVDEIAAARFDGLYHLSEEGFFRSIKMGLRYSDHHRVADLSNDNNLDPLPDDVEAERTAAANANCRMIFPERDWMADGGTNIDRWATFNSECMYRTLAGTDDLGPEADPRSVDDLDITERISAGYVMANFASDGGLPFTGNVGVRAVYTDVKSVGLRSAFTVIHNDDGTIRLESTGDFETNVATNDFWRFLPSLNVNFSVTDKFHIRAAAYRALSRPNIEDMGAGRNLLVDDQANPTSVLEAISGATGGSPTLEPLMSWNGDLSFEYYASADSAISLALFYKRLSAGIVPAEENLVNEVFVIDGQDYTIPVAQQANSNEKSSLWGFEVSGQVAFTSLPGLLSGFGVIGTYAYADTDFEYADPSIVDGTNPLSAFTVPASFPGFSKHTGTAQLYWEKYGLTLRALYKFRSRYFKPSLLTANRYTRAAQFLDLSASYDINKHVQVRLQAINVLNEPQIMDRPVTGSITETSYSGPKFYTGVKLRF